MNSDLTDQYLVSLFDNLQRENQKLLYEMKSLTSEDMKKETDIQKQNAIISTLMTQVLKLRNLKKKIALKLAGN
jgi:hypothetical protein